MAHALTLYELNSLVRGTLEATLTEDYWLQAELSEVREGYNGHCYVEFVEKDRTGRQLIAKARGTIWNSTYKLLKPYFERETGQMLVPGLKVLVNVHVSFHELYGYSLTVVDIDPSYTIGDIARRRKEILLQLEQEGILNDNKELRMPLLANRVAVISSATAAGYGDFCNQLLHNQYHFRFRVKLFPAVMQGDRVEPTVLKALDDILEERDSWDVVVIIRGGGATSDLSGFDTYLLAASCAQFPIPVITGIGHERDDTVLDMVSHTRVKTPTAAAAFLISHQLETASRLEELRSLLLHGANHLMDHEHERLERQVSRLPLIFSRLKSEGCHRLDVWAQRLRHAAMQRVAGDRHKLDMMQERMITRWPVVLEREQFKLKLLEQRCEAANPDLLLKRGYSMTFHGTELVRDVTQLKAGDKITTRLAKGEIHSVVE